MPARGGCLLASRAGVIPSGSAPSPSLVGTVRGVTPFAARLCLSRPPSPPPAYGPAPDPLGSGARATSASFHLCRSSRLMMPSASCHIAHLATASPSGLCTTQTVVAPATSPRYWWPPASPFVLMSGSLLLVSAFSPQPPAVVPVGDHSRGRGPVRVEGAPLAPACHAHADAERVVGLPRVGWYPSTIAPLCTTTGCLIPCWRMSLRSSW